MLTNYAHHGLFVLSTMCTIAGLLHHSCRVLLLTSVTIELTIDAAKHHVIVLRDHISFVVSSAVNVSILL